MNRRIILNLVYICVFAWCLAAAPASQSADKPDAPELTELQQNQLMQLSDAEANIQAINRALAGAGYKVGEAYNKINSNQAANWRMNQNGGGPVRWDEFYGATAKAYASNGWNGSDASWGDRRPKQFAFIYKANNDQIAKANDQIASLKNDQDQLLKRRQKHEEDQSQLWAMLSWEQVKDREIDLEPICRYALKPAGAQAEALRPVILFLRTANSVATDGLDSITSDQAGTFASGDKRMAAAFLTLQTSLADALAAPELKPDQVKEAQALKAMCKTLAEQCKVISDNYVNAQDRDKAKEDNSKLGFRGQLQSSLSNFAREMGQLDDDIAKADKDWEIGHDISKPTPDLLPLPPVAQGSKPAPSTMETQKTDGILGVWDVQGENGGKSTETFNADGTCTLLGKTNKSKEIPGQWHASADTIVVQWDNGNRHVWKGFESGQEMTGVDYIKPKGLSMTAKKRDAAK